MSSQTNKVTIGDNNTIHGSVVAAQSILNSFNSVDKVGFGQDIQDALNTLKDSTKLLVEQLENKTEADAVSRDVKGFCEEVNTDAPRERTLQYYLSSIGDVASKAGAIGLKVIGAISSLSPLLKLIAEHASN